MPAVPACAHCHTAQIFHCTRLNFFRIGSLAIRFVRLLLVFCFAAYASHLEPLPQHPSRVVGLQPLSHIFSTKSRIHHLSSSSLDSRPSQHLNKHGEKALSFFNDPNPPQHEPLSRSSAAAVTPHNKKGNFLSDRPHKAQVFVPVNLYGFAPHQQQSAIQGSRSSLPFHHLYPRSYLVFQPSLQPSFFPTSFSTLPPQPKPNSAACCKVSRFPQSSIYFYCLASTGNCEDFNGVPVLLISGHYLEDPSECPSNQPCPSPERVVMLAVPTPLPDNTAAIFADHLHEMDSTTAEEAPQLRRIYEKLQAYQENAEQWRRWSQKDAPVTRGTMKNSNAQAQKTAQSIAVQTVPPRRHKEIMQTQLLTLSQRSKKRREHKKPSVQKGPSLSVAESESERVVSAFKNGDALRYPSHIASSPMSVKQSYEGRHHAPHNRPVSQHKKGNAYVPPSDDPALFPCSDSHQHA